MYDMDRCARDVPLDLLESDARLRRVKTLAAQLFPRSVSLASAARAAGLEPHYFAAYFRRHVRQTFGQWQRSQRVRHALTLLTAGRLSIAAVALRVGYSDLTGLERAFKATLGTTPHKYRRKFLVPRRALRAPSEDRPKAVSPIPPAAARRLRVDAR